MSSITFAPAHAPAPSRRKLPRLRLTTLAMLLAATGLGASNVQAATVAVNTPLDAIAFDGFCSLREAVIVVNTQSSAVQVGDEAPATLVEGECLTEFDTVDPADPFDTIELPEGTFTLTIAGGDNAARVGDLDLNTSVTLNGTGPATTIIDAGGDTASSIANGIFDIRAIDGSVTLRGITVTGGRKTTSDGGGITVFAPGSSVVLDNVRITDNRAMGWSGGGLKLTEAASVILRNGTRIDHNSARVGGGMFTASTALMVSLEGIQIDHNRSTETCGGLRLGSPQARLDQGTMVTDNHTDGIGGGACVSNRTDGEPNTAHFVGVTVRDNTAGDSGGGVRVVAGGHLVMTQDSVIDRNAASDQRSAGGLFVQTGSSADISDSRITRNQSGEAAGINLQGASLRLTRSTVGGNIALNGGGGGLLIANGSNAHIESSLIGGADEQDANVSNFGGGMFVFNNSEATVVNSTVSGNQARIVGGGIAVQTGSLELLQTTVTANVGTDFNASGLSFLFSAGQRLSVSNSLISGNPGTRDCRIDFAGAAVTTNGFNLLGPEGCQELADIAPAGTANLVTADPGLWPLSDNGGPTLTHALLPASLAIDAVTDLTDCANADQRSIERPRGEFCDIGAYEVGGPSALTAEPTAVVMVRRGLSLRIQTRPRATLIDVSTGQPLPGKTVRFTAGRTAICSGVTDASGRASCTGTLGGLLGNLLNGGYTATFDGDDTFDAAEAGAELLRL